MECVYEATPMDFGRIGVVFIETNKQGVRFETDACYEAEKIVRTLIKEEQVEGYDDQLLHGETVAFPADEIWKVWDRWECKKCRRLRLGDPMIRAGSRFCQFCSQELSRNLTEST